MEKKEFGVSRSRRSFVKGVCGGCAALALSGLAVPQVLAAQAGPASGPQPGSFADLAEYAKARFLYHWNCTQAVMEALGPKYGLDYNMAIKVACPFAAGMWKGGTCGSFTGAYMAIGLVHGAIPTKAEHYDVAAVHQRVLQFDKAMQKSFGTLDCSALLGTNMGTPEGIKEAAAKGMFTKVCPKTIVEAVNQVLKINV